MKRFLKWLGIVFSTLVGLIVISLIIVYAKSQSRLTRIYERADVRRLVKGADKRKLHVVPRGGLPEATLRLDKKRRKSPIQTPAIPRQRQEPSQPFVPVVVKPCISKNEWPNR